MTHTSLDVSTPAGIIRLSNAFCDAKALLTAVELGLFTTLDEKGPSTQEEIRKEPGLHGRGLSDWLNLLAALGLLTREEGGRFGNAEGAGTYLVRGKHTYVGGFLERSNRNLYPAWGRLSEALRTGQQQSGSDFEEVTRNPHILRQFVGMMDALTHVVGPELVGKFDWSGYSSVLDVGAPAATCSIIVKAQPHLAGHVFDLPPMEPLFDEKVAEYGLTGKVTFHGGSFFTDPLPSADVVNLGHVLHDWDEKQRGELIAKAYQAVNPGGALLIYDRMLDDEPDHVENLVISLDMLLVTDGGSEYPVSEAVAHAERAGFASTEVLPLSDYDTLVICRKAG